MWSGKSSWPLAGQANSNSGPVDWAALAQAWIQQKASGSGDQNTGSVQESVPAPGGFNNVHVQHPHQVMAPNNSIPHQMQWQHQHRPPWQNALMNPNQNWGMNRPMYQQQEWQRPMHPGQFNHTNIEAQQWQGNQAGQWFDNGPQNGMPVMQQSIGNMDIAVGEPQQKQQGRSFLGHDNQNSNGMGDFDSVHPPPPPLPNPPPPPNHEDTATRRKSHKTQPHEFDDTTKSVPQQRLPRLDEYAGKQDFHHGQGRDFYGQSDQWTAEDHIHNQRWRDDGDNWNVHQQAAWHRHDEGDLVPPLLGQHTFGIDEQEKMDAAKQRKLPRWLREGLEKIEKEKQKKTERDESLKKAEILPNSQSEESNDPLKSKFDSDQGDSEAELSDASQEEPVKSEQSDSESDEEQEKTEEEKQMELMMKVRKMLTEVLLDVTNSEARTVAEEVYAERKKKAQANAIAKPKSSTSQFGLIAGYGSESEGESEYDSNADDDSENEDVQIKIERKSKLFHLRQQEVLRTLEDWNEKSASVNKSSELQKELPNQDMGLEHESLPRESQKQSLDQDMGLEHESLPRESSDQIAQVSATGLTTVNIPRIEPKQRSRSTSSSNSSSSGSFIPKKVETAPKKLASEKERSRSSHSSSLSPNKLKPESYKKKSSKGKRRSRSKERNKPKDSKKCHKSTERRSRSRERKRSGSRSHHRSRRDNKQRRSSRDHSISRELERRSRERKRSRSKEKSKRERRGSPNRKKKRHRSPSDESKSDVGKSSKVKSKSKSGKKVKKKKKHSSSDDDSDSSYERKGKKSTGKGSRRKQSR